MVSQSTIPFKYSTFQIPKDQISLENDNQPNTILYHPV